MKPHVICHMVSSVDGRTLSKRWKMDTSKIYEESAATLDSDAWIVGRVTMAEFASKKPRRKHSGRFSIPKTDFVAPHNNKTYAVGIDPSGKLHWETSHVDTEHVIAVLTEKVTSEYLAHLQKAGVSYIFGGKTSLNLKRVLEKLAKHFGIRRATLQGGGTNNGSFLNAGLIDELSLVIIPFADGEKGISSVFDIEPREKKKAQAAKLSLISTELYKGTYPWLKYSFVPAD